MAVTLPKLPKLPGFAYTKLVVPQMPKEQKAGPSEAPATWQGSDMEWMVAWWLTKNRIPFEYQAPFLGGRRTLGGQVVDFIVADRQPPLMIGVQGEYWHYADSAKRAKSLLAKANLQQQGYTVIYVLGVDLQNRLDYTMRSALNNVQLFQD